MGPNIITNAVARKPFFINIAFSKHIIRILQSYGYIVIDIPYTIYNELSRDLLECYIIKKHTDAKQRVKSKNAI